MAEQADRTADLDRIAAAIRDVPGFPEPGVVFKDISPLLADAGLLARTVELLAEPWVDAEVDVVVGIEARGFMFAGPVALALGAGFVPLRKAGKLPGEVLAETYDLEYGTATIEIHADGITAEQRVLVLDDVLATGGTAAAARQLVTRAGGDVVGMQFLLELSFLDGRAALAGGPADSAEGLRVESLLRT